MIKKGDWHSSGGPIPCQGEKSSARASPPAPPPPFARCAPSFADLPHRQGIVTFERRHAPCTPPSVATPIRQPRTNARGPDSPG